MVKINQKHVEEYFLSNKCVLLDVYKNSKQLMEYRCICGKLSKVSWSNFSRGSRCKYCALLNRTSSRRHTFEYVNNYFLNEDCVLLENEYINSTVIMKFMCKCGENSRVTFKQFKLGQRCKKCGQNKLKKALIKDSIEDIDLFFKDKGCKLLEKTYLGSNYPMRFVCSCGNLSQTNWYNFKRGTRCKLCAYKTTKEKNSIYSIENMKDKFEEKGCVLLENEYLNQYSKMNFACKCGFVGKKTFASFKKSPYCKKCGYDTNSESRKNNIEYIRDFFESKQCRLISDTYNNNKTILDYICSCGNKSKITFNSFKNGGRCFECGVVKRTGPNNINWNPDREYVLRVHTAHRRCASILRRCLSLLRLNKEGRTKTYLKYTPIELQCYLEKHPNYDYTMQKIALTNDKFSVDHIFPIKAFVDYNLDKKEHICLINCLENLKPMPLKENISKSGYYNKDDFEMWLISKKVEFVK